MITTRNLTEVVASRIESDFARIDSLLAHVARGVGADCVVGQDPCQTRSAQKLSSLIEGFDIVAGLYVFDAVGQLRLASRETSPFSINDRPHFRHLRDTRLQRSFSEAQVARATGQWSLVQARPIRAPNGRFLGVASAVIHVEAFARRFAGIEIGPGGVIQLRRSDDFKLIQRMPPLDVKDFNQPLPSGNEIRRRIEAGEPSGSLSYVVSTDGVRRLGSFKRLDEYPFYVQVALSEDDYLAGWHREGWLAAALVLIMLTGLGATMLRIARTERAADAMHAALLDSARHHRSLIDAISNAGIMLFVVDGDYRVRYMNAPMVAAFGDAVGKTCHTDVGGVDQPCAYCKLAEVIGQRSSMHYEPVLADGRIFDIVAEPYIDADGSLCKLEIIRDVTAYHATQQKLRDSEENFRTFFDRIEDFLFILDREGRILHANRAVFARLGYTPEELQGVSVLQIHPATRRDEAQAIVAGMLAGTVEFCPVPLESRDGRLIPVETRVYQGRWNGADALFGVTRDLSALAASEAKFAQAFNSSPIPLAITEPDSGKYVDINPAFVRTTGYARSEVLGRSSFELNLFVDPDQRLHILRDLDDRDSVHGVEVAVRVRDGRVLQGLFSASRLVLQDRKLLLTQMLDITARKRAEADLRAQAQALERSNAELEQFSYSISHDMRQPLRMISSYLQLIERELGATLSADQRGYFHFAIDGAQRLDTMLVGLLEYSRVGRMGEPPDWLESRAVLDDALLFLQPAIAEAGAAMRIAGDWPRLFARRDELLRLLQNLIGNALKFRLAGQPPDIRIEGACSESPAVWRCCIADNGIGILPGQAGRLFQVFQRLQSRARYEGTGIGLALCRKIVEHHDGRIWVESAGENLGSRCCFEIPLADETASSPPAGPAEVGA